MSFYRKFTGACVVLMIALACASVGLAQDSGRAQEEREAGREQREGRRGERGRDPGQRMMGMMRGLRELNLTDAQRQQVRGIMERAVESTRPQREELMRLREQREQGAGEGQPSERAKQLRGEIREAMERGRTEIAGILTPEQRARLEQMEQERKARHEERRKRMKEPQ